MTYHFSVYILREGNWEKASGMGELQVGDIFHMQDDDGNVVEDGYGHKMWEVQETSKSPSDPDEVKVKPAVEVQ